MHIAASGQSETGSLRDGVFDGSIVVESTVESHCHIACHSCHLEDAAAIAT